MRHRQFPRTVLVLAICALAALAGFIASPANATGDTIAAANHTLVQPTDPELLESFRETGAAGVYGTVRRSDGGEVGALKDPRLASPLVLLADASARARVRGEQLRSDSPPAAFPRELRGMIETRQLRLTGAGEVQVFVHVDETSARTVRALEEAGAEIERVEDDLRIVQAQAPADRLRRIAGLPGVRAVRLPQYPVTNAGSEQTEGDAVMNSDDVRSLFGVDGSGYTVGVISDGVAGLAASQASGDLPSGAAMDTTTCNTFGGDPAASGAEGTALLEIVHDVAPGAALMFGNFGFSTVLEFNDAVDCLAANADIVVDDIGWFNAGLYDGTSAVSENTAAALNGPGPIRGYYTSVGNNARWHYQGSFVDSGDTLESTPATYWSLHEFDIGGGPKGTKHAGLVGPAASVNRLVVADGGAASIFLQWDDGWGTSGNDYDLFVAINGELFLCSGDAQNGNDVPAEACGYANDTGSDAIVDIIIANYLGQQAVVEFDLFLNCSGCYNLANGNRLDYNTRGSSVANQGDAAGSPAPVISVGAVPASNPGTIESFSSLGLTNDGRLKPEISAPDGVSVTGNGGFPGVFFGTSASAPHVAAVAALLLECDPSLDRLGLRDRLLNNAIDLGEAGADNTYGYGRIDAFASATKGCAPAKLPEPGDRDRDGCSDQAENGAFEYLGGQRDYLYFWDFFDVWTHPPGDPIGWERNAVINIFDINATGMRFGPGPVLAKADALAEALAAPTDVTSYHAAYDRGPIIGANSWDRAPPDGSINIVDDILGVAAQFGHNCG